MIQEITQYFKVNLMTKTKVIDITDDILNGLRLEDEDGLIKKLSFTLTNGYYNLSIISRGLRVEMYGGDLNSNKLLFSGKIEEVNPKFENDGDINISVSCMSKEKSSFGRINKDLLFPSKTHPKSWGRQELTYSDIIKNLAKDQNYVVDSENIEVSHDITATFKKPVRQKGVTDWAFMQDLSEDIKCTCWTQHIEGKEYLYLKDNSEVINSVSRKAFYYLARINRDEFFDIDVSHKDNIQMNEVDVKLENSKSNISQKTDPKTGETKITATTEKKDEEGKDTGEIEEWVLDEDKVRGLSREARKELIEAFINGEVEWESDDGGVSTKDYFKLVKHDESSRKGDNSGEKLIVSDANGKVDESGVSANGLKKVEGGKTYAVNINTEKVKKLPPEERTKVVLDIMRGEGYKHDKSFYSVIETTPKKEDKKESKKEDKKDKPSLKADGTESRKRVPKSKIADKRDRGFKIVAKIYGRMDIHTKKSYFLLGLGKYSGKYYLYRTIHTWGQNGWEMELTFVK